MLTETEVTRWINGLAALDRDNEIIALSLCVAFGIPRSVLDVGSGDGAMVNTLEKLGVDVNGLDLLPRPNHPKLIQCDLRQSQDLHRKFEWVTSVETAEHLETQYADILVDTIVRHAEKRIVFTAAMPGQMGDGHVNCQPAEYWRAKFHQRGWTYWPADTYRLALVLAAAQQASHHVEANLQVFLK